MDAAQPSPPWWHRIDVSVPVWLLTAAVVWGVRGFQDGLGRDAALYVYAGQAVADGTPPYVEVMNRSGPLAQLLPGAGVALGRMVGLDDVVGVRVLFFLLLVATPALAYLLARDVFDSRLAGTTAAAVLLAFPGLALSATDGPQSKQAMLLFLLIALLLLTRRRWMTAGVATGLATLSWQPVLVILVVVALVIVLLTPGDRRARVVALACFIAGGALTLGVTVAYFLATGSLDSFVEGFWGINAGYTDQQGLLARPLGAWHDVTSWLGWAVVLLLAGSLLSVTLALPALHRGHGRDVEVAALGAGTLAGIGWSLTAFNGAPDAIPILPLAAVAIGGGVCRLVGDQESRRRPAIITVAAWVVVAVAITLHLTWTSRTTVLATERTAAESVFADLPEDASVFVFNAPQPLALTGRESISRFVLFAEGMKDYVAAQWPGGFGDYVDHVREARPDVVVATSRGLVGSLRPLARDYIEVGAGEGWRAFVIRTTAASGQEP